MQKGALINTDSLSMINCWHILYASLKELKRTQAITNDAIEGLFLGFIGQCVKTDHRDVASALHNYLFLARKIALSKACGMGVPYTAKVIGAPLLEGLKLNQRLDEDLAQEYIFMAKVSEALLQIPMFDQPFVAQEYAPWGLSKGAFYSIQATLLGPLGDPNAVSPIRIFPQDVLATQIQLAVMLRSGFHKKLPQQKQVRFEQTFFPMEIEEEEAIAQLTTSMSSFSLVPSETLLKQFEQAKRSALKVPQDEEDPVSDTRKKRRATSTSSAKK